MKVATIIFATALTLGSAAWAQQAQTGIVTTVDRIHGTVAIKQTQSGTVGANTGAGADLFKVKDGVSLEDLHAGDKVSFTATEADGAWTITKFDKP